MGILDGEKSYIFIALYTLDFLICMTLLVLFHMYSRKSTTDEERLKKYYLMSLRGERGGTTSGTHQTGSSGGLALSGTSSHLALSGGLH